MKIFRTNIYHNKRVERVAYKLDIDERIVEESLDLMYKYIKEKIEEVEINEDVEMTKEEFEEKFPIIHIPSLGYLKPSYGKYKHIMKNKKKNGKNKRKSKK